MTSEYRKVSVKLPKNKRFRSINHNEKLIYYYLISNPLTNSAGCYEINPAEIGFDLEFDDRAIHRAIKGLSEAGLVAWDAENEVLLIERALKHWPITNSKHAAGAISRLLELPDCPLRSLRIAEFLEQEKLSEDQKKELQNVLENSVPTDRAMIGLSPSRPDLDQTRPRPDLDHSPQTPQGGSEKPSPPPALEREILDARQGDGVKAPLPAKQKNFPKAVILWNLMVEKTNRETGTEFKPVQVFTSQRKSSLDQRLKECGGIEGWKALLEKVSTAPWLRGDEGEWLADFGWIIKKQNFTKIMEGNYDRRTNKPNTETSHAGFKAALTGG